mgnify:CR=1 FL=1
MIKQDTNSVFKEIWQKIFQTGGTRIYTQILGILTLSITAKVLGPEGRGEIASVITIVGGFATILHLSMGQVVIYISAKEKNMDWFTDAFYNLVFILIILSIIGYVSFILMLLFFNHSFGHVRGLALILAMIMLPFMVWEQYGGNLILAIDRIDISNKYNIIGKTIGFLFLIAVYTLFGLNVYTALLSIIIGQVIISSGGFIVLYKITNGPFRISYSWIKNILGQGLKLHLNTMFAFLLSGTDILMLNLFSNLDDVGYYQFGAQITQSVLILPAVVSSIMYGKVSTIGPNDSWPYHKKIIKQIFFMLLIIILFLYFTAHWWIPIIAGNSFKPSIILFKYQIFTVLGLSISTMMAPQWISRGYFTAISSLAIISGLLNVGLNYFLIQKIGVLGAVYSTLFISFTSLGINGIMYIIFNKTNKVSI